MMLNATFDLKRPQNNVDDLGGVQDGTLDPVANLQGVPCRIYQKTAREQPTTGQQQQIYTHRCVCYVTEHVTKASIKGRDILESGGTSYKVVACEDEHGMGHHLEIDLLEVRSG